MVKDNRISLYFIIGILFLCGCAPTVRKIDKDCPGAQTVNESLSQLRLRPENAVSFRAGGRCRLQYHAEGKKYTENFPVKLWVNPPGEIYMQGDVAFDPKGIVLGSNKNEFWLTMKPKEVSSYWWGRWDRQNGRAILGIEPGLLLEVFGVIPMERKDNWLLSSEGSFDVLSTQTASGFSETIYIEKCNYRISKIVKMGAVRNGLVTAKLDRYEKLSEDFSVPKTIEIISRGDNGDEDSLRIDLDSVKAVKLSSEQRSRLFSRPRPSGFEHVYKVVNGEVVEQTQQLID